MCRRRSLSSTCGFALASGPSIVLPRSRTVSVVYRRRHRPDANLTVPGVEVVGIVDQVGFGVDQLAGQPVITMMQGLGGVRALRNGGYANLATVSAESVSLVDPSPYMQGFLLSNTPLGVRSSLATTCTSYPASFRPCRIAWLGRNAHQKYPGISEGRLNRAFAVITQSPVFWFGSPWIYKRYIDVFTAGLIQQSLLGGDGRTPDAIAPCETIRIDLLDCWLAHMECSLRLVGRHDPQLTHGRVARPVDHVGDTIGDVVGLQNPQLSCRRCRCFRASDRCCASPTPSRHHLAPGHRRAHASW